MTPTRFAAAVAAMISAMLLQATIIGPLTMPAVISLPALVVVIVALRNGPATGMTLGFTAGMTADLASTHPAGVLALTWTLLGVAGGRLRGLHPGGWRRLALLAAGLATAATGVGGVLLTVFGLPGQAGLALRWAPVAFAGHVVLAAALVPVVGAFLRAPALRPRAAPGVALVSSARQRAAGTGTATDTAAWVQRG